MKKIVFVFTLAALTLSCWAGPSYKLDGISIGQPSSELKWLGKPTGKFKHGKTYVEVKNGVVVTIWGEQLTTSTDLQIKVGQDGESARKILGKPNGGTLYGCGTTSQQIHFYKNQGLDLTVTDQKVTAIRLYQAP